MTDVPADKTLVAEFEAFVARAQLPVPSDRREGLIAAFLEMRAMLAVLRQPLPPGAEPAGTFDPASILRQL